MAKQIITKITDDLDGSEADETLTFALDGMAYEIDLNGKNALELREFLARYIDAGTRLGRVENGRPAQVTRYTPQKTYDASAKKQNETIRYWASKNGWPLSDRGRIPVHVVEAYESNTPNPEWVAQRQAAAQAAQSDGEKPARAPRRGAPAKAAFTAA